MSHREAETLLRNLAGIHNSAHYALFRGYRDGSHDDIELVVGLTTGEAHSLAAALWRDARADLRDGRTLPFEGVGYYIPVARPADLACRGMVFLEHVEDNRNTRSYAGPILSRLAEILGEIGDAPPPFAHAWLLDRPDALELAERLQMIHLLRRWRGNKSAVARHLGLTRQAVRYRLIKHGLEGWPSGGSEP